MMEADACRSCVEWARVRTNHSLPEGGTLQTFITQVVFNKLGHRPVEEHVLRLLVAAEPPFNLLPRGRLADPQISATFWAQNIAQSTKHIRHCTPAFHIHWGEVPNLSLAAVVIAPELNARAILEWDKQSIDSRCPPKAALA